MKKIKIILTSVVLVAAFSFAFASSNTNARRFNYFYYPTGATTPIAITSTQQCTTLAPGCFETINGVDYQLYILVNGVYRPVTKP